MPGQFGKNLGQIVQRTTNSEKLVEKGHPETDYRTSSGWTSINDPRTTEYDYLDLEDDWYDGDSEEQPVTETEGEIKEVTMTGTDGEIYNGLVVTITPKTEITGPGLGSIDRLDLATVMNKGKFTFSVFQEKSMCLYILQNKTCQVAKLKPQFDALLAQMGFQNKKLPPSLKSLLRQKVRVRLQALRDLMIRNEACRADEEKGRLHFALWAEAWNEPLWNGDITGPRSVVQKAFESGFNY